MLTTDDILNLFASMRTAYGQQWKHGQDAAGVWREALKSYSLRELRAACQLSLREHTNHPPTLPQFIRLLDSQRPRHSTYLPAPPVPKALRVANIALVQVLIDVGGIDSHQLKLCVGLKNALIEELEGGDPTEAWVDDLHRQLRDLAGCFDREARNRERHEAWLTFRRKRSVQTLWHPRAAVA